MKSYYKNCSKSAFISGALTWKGIVLHFCFINFHNIKFKRTFCFTYKRAPTGNGSHSWKQIAVKKGKNPTQLQVYTCFAPNLIHKPILNNQTCTNMSIGGSWVVKSSTPQPSMMFGLGGMGSEDELKRQVAQDILKYGENAAPTLISKSNLAARLAENRPAVRLNRLSLHLPCAYPPLQN